MKVKLFNTGQSNENNKIFLTNVSSTYCKRSNFNFSISKLFPNFHLYFNNSDILRMNEIGNESLYVHTGSSNDSRNDLFAETSWTTHKKLTTNSNQVAPYGASFNDMKCFEFSSRKQYRYYHVTRYIFHTSLQEYRIVESYYDTL